MLYPLELRTLARKEIPLGYKGDSKQMWTTGTSTVQLTTTRHKKARSKRERAMSSIEASLALLYTPHSAHRRIKLSLQKIR
jgi:hypothetical protein